MSSHQEYFLLAREDIATLAAPIHPNLSYEDFGEGATKVAETNTHALMNKQSKAQRAPIKWLKFHMWLCIREWSNSHWTSEPFGHKHYQRQESCIVSKSRSPTQTRNPNHPNSRRMQMPLE